MKLSLLTPNAVNLPLDNTRGPVAFSKPWRGRGDVPITDDTRIFVGNERMRRYVFQVQKFRTYFKHRHDVVSLNGA